jgi:integrase
MKRARVPNRLSALAVKGIKEPGMYPDGLGLYLQVTPTKDKRSVAKSWIYRYKLAGAKTSREMGLGSVNDFGLQEARQLAQEARKARAAGQDPIEARKATKAAAAAARARSISFQKTAETYIEDHEAGWKNQKHRDQWTNSLKTYVYPQIGSTPVADVGVDEVLKVLKPVWTTKTATATRLRGRIERILDWAKAKGYRTGENPARWRGSLQSLLPPPGKVAKVEHHPALPYADVGGFMQDLVKQEGDAADALFLLVLTATRTTEVIGAKWSEFNWAAKIWTVPPERIKTAKEHRIPLSAPALAMLKKRYEARTSDDAWVFPGRKKGKHLSNGALLALLDRMEHDAITSHGFRSTFRDWAGDETHYPNHVVEMALSHAIGDKVEAAYRRGDLFRKRRALMEDWASYALTPPKTPDPAQQTVTFEANLSE